MFIRSSHKLLATAAIAALVTAPAFAQDADMDEIITTGVVSSKGKNRIDTSISVSAINYDKIQDTAPTNLAEVYRNLPGIRSESSSGGGNSNVAVRGLPISTGGAKYLSTQEDGLPTLLFGDHLFAPADGFVKADSTIARIESVRGGTASTLTTNGVGGIINIIGKTGQQEGGSASISYGLDHDDLRFDAEYGGALADDMYFHLGGHFQQGGDFRDSGYDPISGGQVRGSLTKEFENGFIRVTGKWLDKKDAAYFPQLVSRTDDGNGNGVVLDSIGSFESQSHSVYSNFTRNGLAVDGSGNILPYDLADGLDHKVKAIGAEVDFDLGSGINLNNKVRYQDIKGRFLGGFTNGLSTAADLGAGSTYFNGPNAGTAVTQANLPNGVASNVAIFDVEIDDMSNFANELKLSKSFDLDGGSTVDVTLGHFFMNQNFNQDWHWSEIRTTTENDAVLIATPQSINGLHGVNQAFGWDGSNRNYDLEAEVSAPFAAASWTNDRITLDASVRFDSMTQTGVRLEANGGAVDLNNDGAITGSEASVSLNNGTVGARANLEVDNTAWSVGGNFLVNDGMSVFARASSGASFNFDRALDFGVRNADGTLRPGGEDAYVDQADQYEFGLKLQNREIAGGDLDFYVTGFLTDTEESNVEIVGGAPNGRVREYDSKGVELEANYDNGGFNLFATATFTDAEITRAEDNGVANTALEGNTPQRQADLIWTVSPSYTYDRFRVGGSWVGTSDSFSLDDNLLVQEGYSVVHLYGAVNVTDALEISINVNNAFDKSGITESANDGRNGWDTNGDGMLDQTIGRSITGRTASARLRYKF
ncbi:MAG: TonB-dependent receptor [Hyphomonadaceae bacterium]|nr:TonB-dependent receptor [Hyphomonadaceae bacterium]